MPNCNIHIILSNDAELVAKRWTNKHRDAARDFLDDPELVDFLKENPGAFITDMWSEADVELHENLRFLVSTFTNKQKYVIVTDRQYGMRIQFRVGKYHQTKEVFERNEELAPDMQELSLTEIDRWLKQNLRELCYSTSEIARMKKAESAAMEGKNLIEK